MITVRRDVYAVRYVGVFLILRFIGLEFKYKEFSVANPMHNFTDPIAQIRGVFNRRRHMVRTFQNATTDVSNRKRKLGSPVIVLATIVVMASKGLLELKEQPTSGVVAEKRQ
ncbi:hypothetical protein DPMN_028837 [Dreissena polymorpha]|uniref:Uncharacterized protein n=1 Tax=Dreissena polymorpha TaxID=45954 RepID=A0A9D4LXW8_DREPO|nr:hypothetical protein DPMN_028837 [Dreissena polymorpha]